MDLNYSSQQTFSRAFFQIFRCSPLKFRQLEDFDLSKLYPKFRSPSLNIKMSYREKISFSLNAYKIEYKEKILSDGYQHAAKKRLSELDKAFTSHVKVYIASTFFVHEKLHNQLKVTSFIGGSSENCANFVIPSRNYFFSTFTGTWSAYIEFSRHLYLFCDFSRADGYDVEVFQKNTKAHDNDILFHVDVYIPA